MRNVDFGENELAADAPWLVSAVRENAAYSVAMREFRDAMRGKEVGGGDRQHIMETLKFGGSSGGGGGGGGAGGGGSAVGGGGGAEGGGGGGELGGEGSEVGDGSAVELAAADHEHEHGLESRQGLEEYFASLTAGTPVAVAAVPGRGHGVKAARHIKAGEVLWSESPLVSMQDPDNASKTMACAWCHRSVGDVDAHLSLAAGLCSEQEARRDCCGGAGGGMGGGGGGGCGWGGVGGGGGGGGGGLGGRGGGTRGGWADVAALGLPGMEQVRPARYRPPRHGMPCNSRSQGSK